MKKNIWPVHSSGNNSSITKGQDVDLYSTYKPCENNLKKIFLYLKNKGITRILPLG